MTMIALPEVKVITKWIRFGDGRGLDELEFEHDGENFTGWSRLIRYRPGKLNFEHHESGLLRVRSSS